MSTTLSSPPAKTIDAQETWPGDETALLQTLIGYFEESETASFAAREEAEMARDFVDGHQWTADELRVLRERRQPPSYNNIISRKIALLKGMERRGRSDPKAFARTPADEMQADAATQALRFVADDVRYDVIRSSVFENMLVEGMGGCEVIAEPDPISGGVNVVINHISWDRLFADPHSRHPGFSDAKYLGCVIWQDREDALDAYPGCDDLLEAALNEVSYDTYGDAPRTVWCDAKRRRVRTVQIYWKRRQDWWMATFVKTGFLDKPQKSPYSDRHGNATCPLILRAAMTDRDNNRYGVVRDMMPLQREINKRHSKLLHSLSVNQIIMSQGAVEDEDRARKEAAKPDGLIVVAPGEHTRFEIHKDSAEIQGHFELLQYTIAQMNATGPNANLAGKDPRSQSGRAIIAQQAGGQVENEPLADALRQHTHKVYEAAWMRIRQFWTAEKWIRVTDEDKNTTFVGLNHPLTIAELLSRIDQTAPLQEQMKRLPPGDVQAIQIGMQLPPEDPRLQMVVRVENDVNSIDVEIQVEEGPDNPTLQDEQFQAIMALPPQILMQFPPEFIIKASSLRNKDALVKMIEEHQAAQAQNQQGAQAMQAAQIAKVQADAKNTNAQAIERMHNVASDHAGMPAQNALLDAQAAGARANTLGAMHTIAMDHAASQQPATIDQPSGPVPMAVEAQQHGQSMDQASLALQAQQQAHQQEMDIAAHELAVKQANQPQPRGPSK